MKKWRSKAVAAIRFADAFGERCPQCGEYALPGRLCPTENCDMVGPAVRSRATAPAEPQP